MAHSIDPSFTTLPYQTLGDAALLAAAASGATYADFRFERVRLQDLGLRDLRVEQLVNRDQIGYAVRVLYQGSWGFAAGVELTQDAAVRVARQSVAVATALGPLNREHIELAPEPVYQAEYLSDYELNPFAIDDLEKIEHFTELQRLVLGSNGVDHATATLKQAQENKYFASLAGSRLLQQRVRISAAVEALKVNPETGEFETMHTLAAPTGRGWEYVTKGYDFAGEVVRLPELLAEKMQAPSVAPRAYDLVIDPTNLWLTIHESIGHATEFDRVLGYEANYAGTSFATRDKLGTLQYGSPLLHVTGDRTAPHGLSTIGFDDEGVATSSWDIIKDGILVGYQVNRQMASQLGLPRSNGCAHADSFEHLPLQRMANISLQPAGTKTTNDLISSVDDGLYVVGDKSWSIDMQRYNFQFTGQRFYRIKQGKLVGQVRDAAYQANTLDFWGSLADVGGPRTYHLAGAFNCGKGQPGQVASVSHGCPSGLFRQVNILNTKQEGSS